jgi:hypothetical protein
MLLRCRGRKKTINITVSSPSRPTCRPAGAAKPEVPPTQARTRWAHPSTRSNMTRGEVPRQFSNHSCHMGPECWWSPPYTGPAVILVPSASVGVVTGRDPGRLFRLPDLHLATAATPAAAASDREGEREMKGAGAGAASPGDYVYFKSVVPLHKISVSSSAPRLPPSHLTAVSSPPVRVLWVWVLGLRRCRLVRSLIVETVSSLLHMGSSEFGLDLKRIPGEELSVVVYPQELVGWCNLVRCY